jgi:hypothetical protein
MNVEEKRLLTEFLSQLKAIRGIAKDPEAETLIQRAAAEQPDTVYLLVQKALLQEQGLNAAKERINVLQQQLTQAKAAQASPSTGSFLSQDPWTNPAPRMGGGGYSPALPATPMGMPTMGAPGGASPFGGFLGAAAATAAGVAGGAFLFQGIESLMGHHDYGHGLSDAAVNEAHQAPENVTINQYYGDDYPGNPDGSASHYAENTPIADDDDWGAYDDDVNSVDV